MGIDKTGETGRLVIKQIQAEPTRGFMIRFAKRPLRLAMIAIAKKWPEPTRDNCVRPNTHKLLDIRDKFFRHDSNSDRQDMFEAAFKIFICIYEAHAYYSQRFDWVMEQLLNSGWATNDNNPSKCWIKKEV